ncbi:MAG: M15 family metallopeptidase [Actinomycetota bacterium]|nr:M15 family metallopeptidase [Actinomycetota bacterium]
MTAPATTTTTTTAPPAPAATTPRPATTTPPAPVPEPEPAGGVDPARLPASWREGCPVGSEDLELFAIDYLGFDGAVHTGELVVHADVAADVASVFRTLLDARYPIERMELVDVYGGSDDASTMANNTSAFNCRAITGGSRWSQHSYGRAIDINPVQNPYVYRDGHVLDPAAQRYTDRSLQDPGMIHAGDVVVSAFAAIGWEWGGNYSSIKDYQHFSETGG